MTARVSMLKRPKFRSEDLRRAVAAMDCLRCGAPGPCQAAHSNLPEHGKGMSTKASDSAIFPLCQKCHSDFDQGKELTREERQALTREWVATTLVALIERGVLVVDRSAL